jgi:hypothetical protein
VSLLDDFHAALTTAPVDLSGPELLPERLAHACTQVLPVDGAGISLFFSADRRVPLGASGPVAAEAERLQFTLGEGPCLTAYAETAPVVADEATIATRWPGYYDALVTTTPIRGVVALPLRDALQGIGALDLYLVPPREVGSLGLHDVLTISTEVTRCLSIQDQVMRVAGMQPAWLDAPAAERRSTVWQAIGFLNTALHIESPTALALLRARAYAQGSTVDELAEQIINRDVTATDLALDPDSSR